MITVIATARRIMCMTDDLITSGSIGIPVEFDLSEDFDNLQCVAVFNGSGAQLEVVLTADRTCDVPSEVIAKSGGYLRVGVYARNSSGTEAIPTVWANVDRIQPGAVPNGMSPSAPTPDWTAQVQEIASEALANSETAMEAVESVADSVAAAAASATAAAASASGAAQSATAASGSATSASGSATAAATSAGAAATSATAASTAQAAAETAQGEAEDAQDAAEAAQAAAEAVLASIPADYSELSDSVVDLKSAIDEFESDSNNLWVNYFGVYNGVTFAPNGHGGIKITGTATATGLFSYTYPTALELNGMRLQYDQTGINESGQLQIYCRNASNVIQRSLSITDKHGFSVDSSPRSIKTIQFVVISGVSYNAEIYVSLTETTAETKLYPPKIVNAYYAKYADFLGEPTVDIDFWGDSLTQGYGGNGVTFPNVCATVMGASYRNNGHGGENANTIAAREGGNAWIIPAGAVNGDYTLSNMNDVYGGKVTPLRQIADDTTAKKIYVNGIECTLTRKSQTSPTSDDIIYTVSGYTGSNLVVPTPCRFAGSNYNAKIAVFFVGTNGQTVGDVTDVDARITIIDSMIARLEHDNYIVMGLSNGNDSTRNADDAAMLAHYGNNFFPTRRELVNNGLAIMNITPTANDLVYISSGTVPESLRIDATHLNADGYNALGRLLANKMYSLGFDKIIAKK